MHRRPASVVYDDETQKMLMESQKMVAQSIERVRQTHAILHVIKSGAESENVFANTNGPTV